MRKSTVVVQKVTMLLPADLVRKAKIRAAERSGPGKRGTMTQVVIDALRVALKARD